MNYLAVIDTNVLVSAMLKSESIPGQVAVEALIGKITPLLNDEIISEYREVLRRPKFHFPQDDIEIVIEGMIKRGIFLDAANIDEIIPDPKDVIFYEVVMEAKKSDEAYLVTGNIKHFPEKYFVVTPRQMLTIIEDID